MEVSRRQAWGAHATPGTEARRPSGEKRALGGSSETEMDVELEGSIEPFGANNTEVGIIHVTKRGSPVLIIEGVEHVDAEIDRALAGGADEIKAADSLAALKAKMGI